MCCKPCISAEKRQAFLSKCNGKFMLVLDLISCILMLLLIALRFYYVGVGSAEKPVFHVILSIYLLIFIGLIVAAEFKKEKPRLYFDFLDSQFGRSLFITFTQLLILQKSSTVEIILSIVIFSISLLGICLGYDLGPDGINSITSGNKEISQHKKGGESVIPSKSAKETALDLKKMAEGAVQQYVANGISKAVD